jgi:hypothetical protein
MQGYASLGKDKSAYFLIFRKRAKADAQNFGKHRTPNIERPKSNFCRIVEWGLSSLDRVDPSNVLFAGVAVHGYTI